MAHPLTTALAGPLPEREQRVLDRMPDVEQRAQSEALA